MLVEFNFGNFRSFQEEQRLSMVAGSQKEMKATHVMESEPKSPDLLRSAVIYGPNAAGKSNIVDALEFMQDMVLSSFHAPPEDPILTTPFLLEETSSKAPSVFEVICIQDGVRYQYGFEVDAQRVWKEWLLAYPGGRPQRWFERQYEPQTQETQWYFGDKFKGQRAVCRDATRDNALFFSTCIQLNNQQLKPLHHWFNNRLLIVDNTTGFTPGFTMECCKDPEKKQKILALLNSADLGISDILVEKRTFHAKDFADRLIYPEEMARQIDGKTLHRAKLVHEGPNGLSLSLILNEESQGTSKLFNMAGPLTEVLENGQVLVADEFHNSLHPNIVRHLVDLMHQDRPGRAQLIFTSHDVSILDLELFRRDQIWFVEKNDQKATKLYPLSDFHARKKEAVGRNYLRGRYGALPLTREVNI